MRPPHFKGLLASLGLEITTGNRDNNIRQGFDSQTHERGFQTGIIFSISDQ
jgi:hypothetical protein